MSSNLPMERPTCGSNAEHGYMTLRPLLHQSREQKFCGVWYDCGKEGCRASVLFPSQGLRSQWAEMGATL